MHKMLHKIKLHVCHLNSVELKEYIQRAEKNLYTIGEIYCEAIRQYATSEHLEMLLRFSEFIMPLNTIVICTNGEYKHQISSPLPFTYFAANVNFYLYNNFLKEFGVKYINGRFRRRIHFLFRPTGQLLSVHMFGFIKL
jgi:hypothetical protein